MKHGCHWRLSDTYRFKLNVDTAWTADGTGVGSLIRDHLGRVRISVIVALTHSHSPKYTETFAICEGLRLAERFGYINYTVENDYKVVIDQLLVWSGILSSLRHIHEQILSLVDKQCVFYLLLVVMLTSQHIYWLLMSFLLTPSIFGLRWFSLLFPLFIK